MKINVGSKNKNKVAAVEAAVREYEELRGAEVTPCAAQSGVSDQPLSLEEIVAGAVNRAKNCFENCTYSIGLESGIFAVPLTKSGHMDTTVCAIYDGTDIHLGMSSSFEYPKELVRLALAGVEVSEGARRIGLTDDPKIGEAQGMISILTKGKINRLEYTLQAVRTALIHLQNKELY